MAVLKLSKDDEQKEIEFELNYLLSLTVKQRFEMMIAKSREMFLLMKANGHAKTTEIIKRA